MFAKCGAIIGVNQDDEIVFLKGPRPRITKEEAKELAVALWSYSLAPESEFVPLYKQLTEQWA